jgi:hypothetical protein
VRKRRLILIGTLGMALAVLATSPVVGDAASGRHSVWRGDCGPYGHRGPFGGCIPGGPYGAGNYYFLGPDYFSPWAFAGPPTYGQAPVSGESPDYSPGYWGARPYNIPAFQ